MRQLSSKKDEALEEQTEPLLCVVCCASGRAVRELSASVEEASSRFVVCCWKNRVSVRRFGKHLALEDVGMFRMPSDSRIEAATLFEGGDSSAFLGLVAVSDLSADVLLLPALDVMKGPFCKLSLFDSERALMQFGGQLHFNWIGRIVSVTTEGGGQFFFEVVQGAVLDAENDEVELDESVRLCNPGAKVKEKSKPLGWLGGLFAPNNDEIATLFSKRVEIRKAAAPSSSSPARSKTPPANASDKVSEVKNIMEENKRKLVERGDHINEVGEKASQLEDQSNEFARNIAKLKAKQEKSWFF